MQLWRLILASCAAAGSVSATAQTAFDMIGTDLSRTPARVVTIDDAELMWLDATGATLATPLADTLGLESRTSLDEARTVFGTLTYEPSMLRLVDGRRLTGALSGAPAIPEVLRWQHAVLGPVDVPLEQIDRLVLQRTSLGPGTLDLLPPADRRDVLLLRNGDRLEGFIIDLGRDAVIEVDGREIAVPMESVQQAALANPREAWEGPLVWLRDGSVLGASAVRFSDRLFTLSTGLDAATEAGTDDPETEAGAASVRPEHVSAVAFDTRRLIPVSSLLDGTRVREERSPFNAEPIELRGASSAEVDLPARAKRVSLSAELPLRARAWGRCELLLAVDGSVRARLPLSAASPVIDYELDLEDARRLELILEPGAYGRVQAVVEVRDALIALD